MLPGERAALEGILALLKPSLSIEIGTHKGGSLAPISAHSGAVHAFDLVRHPETASECFPNVTFHIGDSHELLPRVLAGLADKGANVDFVLVDGDHTAVGVRRDLEDLLSSPSTGRTVILLHDTLNERVRAGLEQIDYDAFEKVQFHDLDFVQGRVMREGPLKDEFWCGLGLVVTGWELGPDAHWWEAYPTSEVYTAFATTRAAGDVTQRLGYGQLLELEDQLAEQKNLVQVMERTWSWRLTAPLRSVRRLTRRRR